MLKQTTVKFLIAIFALTVLSFIELCPVKASCIGSSCGPQIAGLSPVAGSVDVNLDTVLTIQFDRNISLSTGFINIYNSEDDSLLASFDTQSIFVGSRLNIVTVNPQFDFSGYSQFYVQITEGAVVDETGTPFAGLTDQSWNFEGSEPQILDLDIGVVIDAPASRSYEDFSFIRYEFALQRSDNNQRILCKVKYSGIKKKSQLYVFPLGAKEILPRFKLRRKQLKKLRAQSSRHSVTIDTTCNDGSSDSKTVVLNL